MELSVCLWPFSKISQTNYRVPLARINDKRVVRLWGRGNFLCMCDRETLRHEKSVLIIFAVTTHLSGPRRHGTKGSPCSSLCKLTHLISQKQSFVTRATCPVFRP